MESNGLSNSRHRRSPSSDRFLNVFPQASSENSVGDELEEGDVFWTGDFPEPQTRSLSPSADVDKNYHRLGFQQRETFGILAALAEDEHIRSIRAVPVLYRKPAISSFSSYSSSRMIPAIPKPPQHEREYSLSVPSRKFHQSAPMNVPVLSKAVMAARANKSRLLEVDGDAEEDDDEMMLPPHEIVARGSAKSPKTTFSVLEGVGRTLKGRDLRQVRNAVWRRTGFLD